METRILYSSLLIFVIGYVNSIERSDMKLELVQVIFRHGARTVTPSEFDLYHQTNASVYERWGFAQLTERGKQMEFDIGVMLNRKYRDFLNGEYKREEVYAYSGDFDLIKMSLELVLAGLYPPTERTTWNPRIPWQPIPYLSTPLKFDVLLESHLNPIYMSLQKESKNSMEYKRIVSPYSNFLEFVGNRTCAECYDASNVATVYEILQCDEYMNVSMPDWYTPEVKEKFLEFVKSFYDTLVLTKEMKKITMGPLIKTLIDNMNINNTRNNPRKMYLYSGQGKNLLAFTRVHGIREFAYTPFGTVLILEKLRDSNNKLYVRLLAWEESGDPKPLPLAGHIEFCPIDEYLALVQDVIPTDEEIDRLIMNQFNCSSKNLRKTFFNDPVVKKSTA